MEPESQQTIQPPKSRLAPILLSSVLMASLIASSGVYAYQHSQQLKQSQDLQAQIDGLRSQLATTQHATPTPSTLPTRIVVPSATGIPTAPATTDSTYGWETYTDTVVGVSFKYPASWSVEKNNGDIDFASPESVAAKKSNTQNFRADNLPISSTSVEELFAKQGKVNSIGSLEDWLISQKGTPAVQSYAAIKMPFVNYGLRTVFTVTNSYPSTQYYLSINNKVFIFGLESEPTDTDKTIVQSIKVTK